MVNKYPANALDGIEEANASGLKVAIAYPNPGRDALNIRTGLKDAWVEIYDINGRLMQSQEITGSITSIPADTWPSGTYVWKVYANTSTCPTTLAETGKWVKE